MTETKSAKKKAVPRKNRGRTSLAARLRKRNAELGVANTRLGYAQERHDYLIKRLDELRETMQSHIDALQERLESSEREARRNREEYERFSQYYREEQEIRRNTREALDLVFATLAPGMPMNTLLEVLESVGKEMYNSRMDIVRPFLIEGLAEGARQGIPLYAKRKQQEKERNEKQTEDALSEAGFLASLLTADLPGKTDDDFFRDVLAGATSEDDGQSTCKDPENCPVHKPGGLRDQLFSR